MTKNLHPSEAGRLDRLPAWARDALLRLDRELTSTRNERDGLARVIGEPSGIGHDITALRVPESKYLHAASGSWTDSLRARFEPGALEVTGNGPLIIKATASNAILVSDLGR